MSDSEDGAFEGNNQDEEMDLATRKKIESVGQKAVLLAKAKRWLRTAAKSVASTSLSWYIDLDDEEVEAEKMSMQNSKVQDMKCKAAEMASDKRARARLERLEREQRLAEEKRKSELRRKELFLRGKKGARQTSKLLRDFQRKEKRRLEDFQRRQEREKRRKSLREKKNPYVEMEAGWLSIGDKPRGRNAFGTRQRLGFGADIKPQQMFFPTLISFDMRQSRYTFDSNFRSRSGLRTGTRLASPILPRLNTFM